jgi:CRISPR-associated protein Csd2
VLYLFWAITTKHQLYTRKRGSKRMTPRYDFCFLFDVINGNPNGDPDANNKPRQHQNGLGYVTDVSIKRKIRNAVSIMKGGDPGFDLYIASDAVLCRAQEEVRKECCVELGKDTEFLLTKEDGAKLQETGLGDGVVLEEEDDKFKLIVSPGSDIDDVLAQADIIAALKKKILAEVKKSGSRKPTKEEVGSMRQKMLAKYWDIRTFGAVMGIKPDCGEARGPVWISSANSVDPIFPEDISITRVAVATEKEAAGRTKNTTFGSKWNIPYGLYVGFGSIDPFFAEKTGFSDIDREALFNAMLVMFNISRSSASGLQTLRKLYILKHTNPLGSSSMCFPLMDLLKITRKDPSLTATKFDDYAVEMDVDPALLTIYE